VIDECDESVRLIGAATEGHVGPEVLDRLVAHLERCAGCSAEASGQIAVKRVLATRPDEPLPIGLARRLAERLAIETRPPVAAGRAWSSIAWRVAAAAAMVAICAAIGVRAGRRAAPDLSASVATFGSEQSAPLDDDGVLREASDPQTLGVLLLVGPARSHEEGRR
jgi:hypothetical protein